MSTGGERSVSDGLVFSIVLAGAMIAWAGVIGWETYLSGKVVADVSAPAVFPTIICVLLCGLASALVVDAFRNHAAAAPAVAISGSPSGGRLRVLAVLACLIVYAAVMPSLGFYLATPLTVIAMAWFSGMRRPLSLLVLAVAFTALLYALFSLLLRVPLPPGITYGWRLW